MEIQSLSICVPAGCPNRCKFCVSKTHRDLHYQNVCKNWDEERESYGNRMSFARDNGCNTLIFTGEGEPLYNYGFVTSVLRLNRNLNSPFRWIEIQTSGIDLNSEKLEHLKMLGLTTVSLSLSSIFSDAENAVHNGTPEDKIVNIEETCELIKKFNLNLRLSLNLTDNFSGLLPENIFKKLEELGANQVTFRILYKSPIDNEITRPINKWIEEHSCDSATINFIKNYIIEKGTLLEKLPFGAYRYGVGNISSVVDVDCMNQEVKNTLKFLILRPDNHLYTRWENKSSLLF